MQKIKLLLLLLLLPTLIFSQKKYFKNKFQHYQIIKKNDTINFHIYGKESLQDKEGFVLYIQGSNVNPLYRSIQKTDTIRFANTDSIHLKKYVEVHSSVPFKLKKTPKNYPLVLVSKKTLPFESSGLDSIVSKQFYERDGINYRAWQNNEVINYMIKNLIKKPKKVMVIGHSEGSDVVAKLGTINKQITHIGFWSGGGNTQFYDFALFIRKKVISGEITEKEGQEEMEQLFSEIKDIYKHPKSLEKQWLGHPYKKWVNATEPAINNLLQIDIPIFVAIGAKDKAVPMESSLLIPIEFIRHQKTNLTYKVYPNLDHSFIVVDENKNMYEWESKWNEIFKTFLLWCDVK